MNQKEVSELRRRWRPERTAVSRIYGCFVNSGREIVSWLDESLGTLPVEESEMYLGLMKRVLSGKLGKNLIDIVFSTRQVADSDEHRLLSSLRESGLKNGDLRREFCQKVIDCLDMGEDNYLLLLAYDEYDVPRRNKSGGPDGSDTVFSYILCCVCPVKEGKAALGYYPGDNEFHCAAGQTVAPPELGFLFPAFDGRAANLYNVLFYSRKPDQLHQEFIDGVFRTEPPMSAAEQREAFEGALCGALEDDCSLEVVQAIHSRLADKLEEERGAPEPPALTAGEVAAVLAGCGVPEERIDSFRAQCAERFGEGAALNPANLIDPARFEIRTGQALVSLDPGCYAETRVIDGRRYLLLPVEGDVEVNGLTVRPAAPEADEPEDG